MEAEADAENQPFNPRRVSFWSRTRCNGPKCNVGMLNLCRDLTGTGLRNQRKLRGEKKTLQLIRCVGYHF